MVYEAMLMFGVVFISGWLFSTLLQQRHALYLRHVMQYWLFLVIGLYFVWFWTHGGQTLAMKTWRIRLITENGGSLPWQRALARYLLSWLWILPGFFVAWLAGAKGWLLVLIPAINIVLWAMTAYLDPKRQFLHDRLLRTQVVSIK
ncbi:RDD family protein [Noviherbaspirillum sp. 17J57-3]|uniref:RDD family protein n=2 Tax=Noviherbaspirillum galbum TaxID=2709383 RepID=A0A6B3SLW1_9BURK|nr:RDD family protein [Noviherbaspirillum galbum]